MSAAWILALPRHAKRLRCRPPIAEADGRRRGVVFGERQQLIELLLPSSPMGHGRVEMVGAEFSKG